MSTIEDVQKSEGHVELIDGKVIVQDRTTTFHNIAVNNLSASIRKYIAAHGGTCSVFTESVALYVNEMCHSDQDFYLPDIMLVCDRSGIREDGVHIAPTFVAEITSDSSKAFDYGRKKEIYQRIGVEEYWIVDIQKKIILKHLASEEYVPQIYMHPETMRVTSCGELFIDVLEIMQM